MKKQNNDSIRAHFIRSVLCVLLLVAVCVIPFALAQRNANNRSVAPATSRDVNAATALSSSEGDQSQPAVSSGTIGVPFTLLAHPKDPQVVLYDQDDNASVIGTLSATFTDFPTFNSDLADDFVVPTGQTWNVQSIDADGVYLGPGPANSFNVFFYADNGGLPGTQVYSAMNQSFSVAGSTFSVSLPTVAVLTQGNLLGRDSG